MEAVTAPLGPVLVLAGAGSGKTRVLTYRIAYLIKEKLFAPENILALTFTNKAAGEMKERIERLLGATVLPLPRKGEGGARSPRRDESRPGSREGEGNVTMGTFHAVCARLLRSEIENLGESYNKNFVIYDAGDSLGLVKQIVMELGLSEKFRPQVFSYYISAAKNRLLAIADLDLDNSYFAQTLEEVFELYQKRLREHNALDFDDLLLLVCKLFKNEPAVLKKYQKRFGYVLVDEYQDTNHAQYTILKYLVATHKNLFVVGDDAQSIYGFRGANMQNILGFQKDYAKAKIVMLEQNYRSTQSILDVADNVIKLNPFQYEKKLWTESKGGPKVNLYEAADERDESEFVIRTIAGDSALLEPETADQEYQEEAVSSEDTPILNQFLRRARAWQRPKFNLILRELPSDLNDTVILYRTHAQSRPFEEALLSSGIPYQIVGGIKFYERKEIKDALSFLRLVMNPRDLVSFSRIINEPARGIGPATLRELMKGLLKYEYNFGRVSSNLESLGLRDKVNKGAKDFFDLYGHVDKLPSDANLLELMDLLLTRSGYKENLLLDGEEGATRWENIEELYNVAGKYKKMDMREALSVFLEEVALMTDLDSIDEQGDKLTLMTLHSAKGLEFGRVFFVGLEEGLLPHSRSLLNPQEIAEEIRLAYVGITRAKKDLYLSFARTRQTFGELKQAVPSRILKAIPKKLINKLNEKT